MLDRHPLVLEHAQDLGLRTCTGPLSLRTLSKGRPSLGTSLHSPMSTELTAQWQGIVDSGCQLLTLPTSAPSPRAAKSLELGPPHHGRGSRLCLLSQRSHQMSTQLDGPLTSNPQHPEVFPGPWESTRHAGPHRPHLELRPNGSGVNDRGSLPRLPEPERETWERRHGIHTRGEEGAAGLAPRPKPESGRAGGPVMPACGPQAETRAGGGNPSPAQTPRDCPAGKAGVPCPSMCHK